MTLLLFLLASLHALSAFPACNPAPPLHTLHAGKGRSAMLLLKNRLLPTILIRRTKVQCADELALPPRCGIRVWEAKGGF